ncbi:hypothetical protein BDW59DRAFT_146802 [Aspergillus cavernicola]|uniref:Uncharacterized protein n=1 Tax=Aspergillus cavernicola TaxID=176166 RepID=A0ABR4IAS0_9EURO
MPPQGGSRKLSPHAQHALIRKYNISIEGPIRRRDWPARYAPIFGLVRDMEKIHYDEYCTRDYAGDDARVILVSNMCNRVESLVSRAHALRASLDNEETWRLKTENLILERFETDVNCHICAHRRWISDFQAIPSCPASAAKLQSVRQNRKLCQCSEFMRAKLLAEQSSQNTFVTKGGCTFVDRSMIEIQKKMLTHHKPDRVLGLGRADELKQLLAANPSILATVIGDDMEMYFPFLILEAKSEKNSVGFESIERQTVFPIRAMIGLQQSLEASSNVQSDQLVWFLANRGDEWRVYASVPDRAQIRIIDLWHGSILRHDSALQLLLVIDLLCDWARDIFMERIMSCLRERAGPDYPGLLSQSSVEVLAPIQSPPSDSPPTPPRATTEPGSIPPPAQSVYTTPEIVVKSEMEDVLMDAVPHISTEDTSTPKPSTPNPPIQPSLAPSEEPEDGNIVPDHWPEHIALRSDLDVQLRFRSLSLPESAHDLSLLLTAIDGEAKIAQTGRKLLDLFNLTDPFITKPDYLAKIAGAWGKREPPFRPNGMPLLYACLHWRATFDYVDWVLMKEFACITASQVAIAALARISNVPAANLFPGIRSTNHAQYLIHPLRYLPLPELVQAASKNQFLHLKMSNGHATAEGWTEDPEKAAFSERLWECRDSQPKAFIRCLENVYSVTRGTSHFIEPKYDVKIPPLLQVPEIAKSRQFALLRIPPIVEITSPLYCVFDFDTSDSPDPYTTGRAILSFLREGFSCFYGTNLPLTALDREQLALWSTILINLKA